MIVHQTTSGIPTSAHVSHGKIQIVHLMAIQAMSVSGSLAILSKSVNASPKNSTLNGRKAIPWDLIAFQVLMMTSKFKMKDAKVILLVGIMTMNSVSVLVTVLNVMSRVKTSTLTPLENVIALPLQN